MATLFTGVAYRIQNVAYQTHIEIPDPSNVNIPSELCPLKDTKRQQWYLEADGAKYYIRSAATDGNLYLGQLNTYVYCRDQASCSSFTATRNNDGTYALNNGSNALASSAEHLKTIYAATNSLDNQKWNLIPVTTGTANATFLADGYYRARSLGGQFSLTMSRAPVDGSAVRPQVYVASTESIKDNQSDDHQRWLITRKANGRYTLQNSGRSLYASCDGAKSSRGDTITANAQEYEWDIQSIGGFLWSVRLPLGKDSTSPPLSFGFADGEANNGDVVSLQPSDLAKSQMWFFEKYVALSGDKVEANREIAAGVYNIKNCRDKDLHIAARVKNGWDITSDTFNSYKFELQYVANTAKFTLKYVRGDNELKIPVKYNADMLVSDENPAEFVLTKNSGTVPGYYICPADSGSSRKVVTTRIKKDPFSGREGLALDPKIEGDTSQMWIFL